MNITRVTTGGFGSAVTGADISAQVDGSGAIFWTCQVGIKDQPSQQTVFRIDPETGIQERVPMPIVLTGRGQLTIINGQLVLCAWNEKEGKVGYFVPVPKWVPTPAATPSPPGVGGVALFPAPIAPAQWDKRTVTGGVLVDIPATFGVAAEAVYLIRLSGLASAAGVIIRAGTESAPYFVTLVTQVAGVRVDTQGWVPGPTMLISVMGGSAQVWLQLIGFA
jgi:hypothetical protein